MRPATLDDLVGQDRWLGPQAPLRQAIDRGHLHSLLLWGPPGCGKTTLAHLLARAVRARLVVLSAVLDGVKQLREVLDDTANPGLDPRPVVLFVDEIHRWNKAQQDALLPHVESGRLVLLGATTENPSVEVVAALRSRLRVVRLEPLDDAAVTHLLRRALAHPDGLARPELEVEPGLLERIAAAAAGDARRALQDLERAVELLPAGATLTAAHAQATIARDDLRHDRTGDDHHDVTSALIKSMRGSDPDAAVYWLARMISGGEDPRFICRRLIVFASEDVGNADPRALSVAVAAAEAIDRIGMPEGRIVLSQAVLWLACCPKSDAAYRAIDAALADVARTGALPVPMHLRSRPVPSFDERKPLPAYVNPHEQPHRVVRQEHRPAAVADRRYYEPTDYGDEKTLRARLSWWADKLSSR